MAKILGEKGIKICKFLYIFCNLSGKIIRIREIRKTPHRGIFSKK